MNELEPETAVPAVALVWDGAAGYDGHCLSYSQFTVVKALPSPLCQVSRCGLASMYPASGCAPGHHGYQRAFELISGQASNGPFGSPVFASAGKTDPPSSSHPLADLGG